MRCPHACASVCAHSLGCNRNFSLAEPITPDLRDRLLGMRAVLLAGLEKQIDAGHLALLAGINAALLAADAQAVAAEDAARAIVADDGSAIRLVLYREDEAVAAVTVNPVRAIALAGDLIAAAAPKLK